MTESVYALAKLDRIAGLLDRLAKRLAAIETTLGQQETKEDDTSEASEPAGTRCREAFETWIRSNRPYDPHALDTRWSGYVDVTTDSAWTLWKAAWAASEARFSERSKCADDIDHQSD